MMLRIEMHIVVLLHSNEYPRYKLKTALDVDLDGKFRRSFV